MDPLESERYSEPDSDSVSSSSSDTSSSSSSNFYVSSSTASSSSDEQPDEEPDDEPDEPEDFSFSPDATEPLYENSPLSVFESYVLLLQFSLRFSLSKNALAMLLKILAAHLPRSNKCARSVYLLRKFFERHLSILEASPHRYCRNCHSLTGVEGCKKCIQQTTSMFLEVPLIPQLKDRFSSKLLYKLQYIYTYII